MSPFGAPAKKRLISDPLVTRNVHVDESEALLRVSLHGCHKDEDDSVININDFIGLDDDGVPQLGLKNLTSDARFKRVAGPKSSGATHVEVTVGVEESNTTTYKIEFGNHLIVNKIERTITYVERIEELPQEFIPEGQYATDPIRDGNIVPGAFAVASDPRTDRAVIAYKTQVDDNNISFAEASFKQGTWSVSKEIDVYPDTVPGNRFALVYDPSSQAEENNGRHLFFSEEDGDGYVLMQSYNVQSGKWDKPEKLRTMDGKESSIKAHRFSGFAATFVTGFQDAGCDDIVKRNDCILLYFINESNELNEYTGKRYGSGCEYRWSLTKTIEEGLTMRGAITAVHRHRKTYVVYRNSGDELAMAIASERENMPAKASLKIVKGEPRGKAKWENIVLLKRDQLSKNSPLAIAYPEAPKNVPQLHSGPVVFFLRRERGRKTETIYAYQLPKKINESTPLQFYSRPRLVGKLEPGSNLGAASLGSGGHYSIYGIRLMSVSKHDGENVLVERIQKGSERGSALPWILSGGVIDTDVDHIVVSRSKRLAGNDDAEECHC